jgi:lysophospholipase L1-like esterase
MSTNYPAIVAVVLAVLAASGWGADAVNLLRNGDFEGTGGWGGLGSDDKKDVAVVTAEGGGKTLMLRRKQADAGVAIDQTVRLKSQTLYKLSATGFGSAQAALRLRPYASKDKDYNNVSKCWATSTAPFEPADKPRTMEFVFDSGLKVDSAAVSVYLADPKQLGEFQLQGISLTEMGSSKPAKDEPLIAHLGDSITITSYLPFHQRVERLLAAMTEKEFPGVKTRHVNFGADGEYVKDLLDSGRYDKVVKENFERLDVAFIRYGANDSRNGPPEEFKKQLARLCDNLLRDYPGITIVLGTGPYVHQSDYVNKTQYGPYWQVARDLAKEKGYRLVDVYARFEKEQSSDLQHKPGDMHPSPLGVRVMAEEEFKALKQILAALTAAPK